MMLFAHLTVCIVWATHSDVSVLGFLSTDDISEERSLFDFTDFFDGLALGHIMLFCITLFANLNFFRVKINLVFELEFFKF
jgi:hypothetical protein